MKQIGNQIYYLKFSFFVLKFNATKFVTTNLSGEHLQVQQT